MKNFITTLLVLFLTISFNTNVVAKSYHYKKHRCMSDFEDSFGPTLLTGYSNQDDYYIGFGMRYKNIEMAIKFPLNGENYSLDLMYAKPLGTYRTSFLIGAAAAIQDFKNEPKLATYPVIGFRFIIKHGGRLAFSPYVSPTDWEFKELNVGATLSFNFY